jgi:hypothetical protein
MISRNKLRIFKVVVASIIFWIGASSCAYRGRPIPERVVDTLQQRLAIQDVQFLFMGLRPRPTTQVHESIIREMGLCLNMDSRELPPLQWFVADTILGDPSGILSYGVTGWSEEMDYRVVILEDNFWWDSHIISHELIHVYGFPEGHPTITYCSLRSGSQHPVRFVPIDSIPALRERAEAVSINRDELDAFKLRILNNK